MRIDLHTHTRASDGTQTPEELVRAAKAEGLDVLGLTDHDTDEGWDEATRTAQEVGLTLVRGMEISTRHLGRGAHLLAYLPDPTYPPLVTHLRKILDGRSSRVPAMLERLREVGVDVDIADVQRAADGTAATGRPHVADALVALGVVPDRSAAFQRYLKPGRPAYVNRYAAPLVEMVRVVQKAGGVTVLAHPWGRHGPDAMPRDAIAELAGLGLAGLEVDHQDHRPADREGAPCHRPRPRAGGHRQQRPPRAGQVRARAGLQHDGVAGVRPAARARRHRHGAVRRRTPQVIS